MRLTRVIGPSLDLRIISGNVSPCFTRPMRIARLFSPHIGILYDLTPLRDFGLDERGKYLRCIAPRYCALSYESRLHIGHIEDPCEFATQLEGDFLWHSGRSN
jgi:hypothetical protein